MISIGCCSMSAPLALRSRNGVLPANSHALRLMACRNLRKRLSNTRRTWIPTLITLSGDQEDSDVPATPRLLGEPPRHPPLATYAVPGCLPGLDGRCPGGALGWAGNAQSLKYIQTDHPGTPRSVIDPFHIVAAERLAPSLRCKLSLSKQSKRTRPAIKAQNSETAEMARPACRRSSYRSGPSMQDALRETQTF